MNILENIVLEQTLFKKGVISLIMYFILAV